MQKADFTLKFTEDTYLINHPTNSKPWCGHNEMFTDALAPWITRSSAIMTQKMQYMYIYSSIQDIYLHFVSTNQHWLRILVYNDIKIYIHMCLHYKNMSLLGYNRHDSSHCMPMTCYSLGSQLGLGSQLRTQSVGVPNSAWGPFYQHGWTLIPASVINYIHYIVWDEITCLFQNVKGATVDVWEWTSNFRPHFTGHVMLVKEAPGTPTCCWL